MQMKGAKGQGVLMTVMMLGILMATVIIFAAKRHADVSVLTGRLDSSQMAAEVLSAATKRVQSIYATEASCDPVSLNDRLSKIKSLGTNPNSLGLGSGLAFAVAQPTLAASSERFNLCASATTGCRQIAVNLENYVYVVTVGNVVAMDPDTSATPKDCPQDVNVHLSVAIGGSVFNQWSTLINVCTLKSCSSSNTGDAGDAALQVSSSFMGAKVTVAGGSLTSNACGVLPARYYGAVTFATNTEVNSDDLRWARRYLETGGGDVGEISDIYVTGTPPAACPIGTGECIGKACVPAFDLNMDRTNNEADLGVLELYLRGYLLSLPVTLLR